MSSSSTTATTAKVLYRNLLRNANSMKDYNFRSYAIRRIRTGYNENKSIQEYVLVYVVIYNMMSILIHISLECGRNMIVER